MGTQPSLCCNAVKLIGHYAATILGYSLFLAMTRLAVSRLLSKDVTMRVKMFERIRAFGLSALSVGLMALASPAPVAADEHGHHEFHGHDARHFDRHELGLWRGGLWRHEFHNGRMGWWWLVGGVWYFYDAPVYPYPVVVSEMAFAEPMVIVAPPPAMVAPPAPMVVQPAPPPPQQMPMWYYCDNPAGYYPYVATCGTPFRPVPARPQ